MGLKISEENKPTFELLSPSIHEAICIGVYDLGPQVVEFQGVEKVQNKVRLQFEVPDERITWTDSEGVEHEGPKTIGKTYTASLFDKSNLCQHLTNWRGRPFTETEKMGFDISKLAGLPCRLSVTHKTHPPTGNTYADIATINPATKANIENPPKPENEPVVFDLDNYTDEQFGALAPWMQEVVLKGKENIAKLTADHSTGDTKSAPDLNDDPNDDIPF